MNTTDEHLAVQIGEAETVQWGSLVTLPTGASDVELAGDRAIAVGKVRATNHALGADAAKLMYRTVTTGPWRGDLSNPGNQWGVRFCWPEGDYVEVEPADSRVEAERTARTYRGHGTAQVVTRQVTYGDWWLAAGEGTSHG